MQKKEIFYGTPCQANFILSKVQFVVFFLMRGNEDTCCILCCGLELHLYRYLLHAIGSSSHGLPFGCVLAFFTDKHLFPLFNVIIVLRQIRCQTKLLMEKCLMSEVENLSDVWTSNGSVVSVRTLYFSVFHFSQCTVLVFIDISLRCMINGSVVSVRTFPVLED